MTEGDPRRSAGLRQSLLILMLVLAWLVVRSSHTMQAGARPGKGAEQSTLLLEPGRSGQSFESAGEPELLPDQSRGVVSIADLDPGFDEDHGASTIEVRVVDGRDHPLSGCTVRLIAPMSRAGGVVVSRSPDLESLREVTRSTTNAHGVIRFAPVVPQLHLVVAEDGASTSIPRLVDPHGDARVTVRISDLAQVVIAVVDVVSGAPVPGALCSAEYVLDAHGASGSVCHPPIMALSDAGGVSQFVGVEGEVMRVWIRAQGYCVEKATARPGDWMQVVTLTRAKQLTVRLASSESGSSVVFNSADGSCIPGQRVTCADGSQGFEFGHLRRVEGVLVIDPGGDYAIDTMTLDGSQQSDGLEYCPTTAAGKVRVRFLQGHAWPVHAFQHGALVASGWFNPRGGNCEIAVERLAPGDYELWYGQPECSEEQRRLASVTVVANEETFLDVSSWDVPSMSAPR